MPVALFDTECYPNYWLLKFKSRQLGWLTFRILNGQSFTQDEIDLIAKLFADHTCISFYGREYDEPMISAALCSYNTSQLKWLNDQLIVYKVKQWDIDLPRRMAFDHIDIMEVAPGAGSLKQYVGRIHGKTIRDLPYDPNIPLLDSQIIEVEEYCENDVNSLEELYEECKPLIEQREFFGKRYGIDLRSKSDAQMAEAILKYRCEQVLGRRIYKPEIDYNFKFRYEVPSYIDYTMPQLQDTLNLVRNAVFEIDYNGRVKMPEMLEGRLIPIGQSVYKIGIGGLHSQEETAVHIATDEIGIYDNDVASYYPSLILNSCKYPPALGEAFAQEYKAIIDERLDAKALQGKLKKSGDTSSHDYITAQVGNEGGKIMINGTFGKCGSSYSVLFAPTMLIQTTVTGQLSLLMLIEWHEAYGIQVISANTDGMVIKCRRDMVHISKALIAEWERRTNLTMETVEYQAIYSRDVNNYYAIKTDGEVKRKGEYAKAGLIAKKNPDVEICSDAVAQYLLDGTPLAYTIAMCVDIRKFVTVQKVAGGGVKLWGEGPRKGVLVRDMVGTLEASGWVKVGRQWQRGSVICHAAEAYEQCFAPQRREYLGKVVRWYYGTQSPGPIVYATNGNTVSLSYGAKPCMTLPDEFPSDIDYQWYIDKAENILKDIGYK